MPLNSKTKMYEQRQVATKIQFKNSVDLEHKKPQCEVKDLKIVQS